MRAATVGCFFWLLGLQTSGATLPQTPFQRQRFAEVETLARQASEAALPDLLAALDRPELRRTLAAACPSLAEENALSLLDRLRTHFRSAEVVSGFSATTSKVLPWDMSVEEGRRSAWFENQWEVRINSGRPFKGALGWFQTQDDVETRLYGLRPFGRSGAPSSLGEAAERGPYTSLNAVQADVGAALYGDVSAVFSSEAIQNLTLISAVDSGGWTTLCNSTSHIPGFPTRAYRADCNAYNFTLGTFNHFDHLFLSNLQYWRVDVSEALGRQLARTCRDDAAPNEIHSTELFRYWEAIPAGRLLFPDSIKFFIGSFPGLFGTKGGASLQQWCRERGWALVWSLGLNVGHSLDYWTVGLMNRTFRQGLRLLDPSVLPSTAIVNITLPPDAAQSFSKMWDTVSSRRSLLWPINTRTWASNWADLTAQLPSSLRVSVLRPGQCGAPDRCLGVAQDGRCVCYDRRHQGTNAATL